MAVAHIWAKPWTCKLSMEGNSQIVSANKGTATPTQAIVGGVCYFNLLDADAGILFIYFMDADAGILLYITFALLQGLL